VTVPCSFRQQTRRSFLFYVIAMATYEYDEAGVMAAYFLITFLALVLVPLTISVLTTRPGG
jgi:hypothetical protein